MKLSCTQKLCSLLVALTMSSGVAMASNSATMNYAPSGGNVTNIGVEQDDDKDANEAAYAKLSAEVDAIQAEYDALYAQFVAIAQVKGTGWAASFGNGLGALQSGINAMKGALGNAYAAGTLTLETTLADVYEQYNTVIETLEYYKALFAEIETGISSVEYDEQFSKGKVYDMNGRRVTSPRKGMFIINGKKVIVK